MAGKQTFRTMCWFLALWMFGSAITFYFGIEPVRAAEEIQEEGWIEGVVGKPDAFAPQTLLELKSPYIEPE